MLDWKLAMRQERAALKRIVALLFALADLAERARHRSRLVRRFVIWILRPAQTVARDFVGLAGPPPALTTIGSAGDADAIWLADNFRDLARELDRQARSAFAVQDGIHDDAGQAVLARLAACRRLDADVLRPSAVVNTAGRAACATGPHDTS